MPPAPECGIAREALGSPDLVIIWIEHRKRGAVPHGSAQVTPASTAESSNRFGDDGPLGECVLVPGRRATMNTCCGSRDVGSSSEATTADRPVAHSRPRR